MACCLTLAVLVALVRRLLPGRHAASEFAPPAYRAAASDAGPQHAGAAAWSTAAPRRTEPAAGRALTLGLGAGITAYLVNVLVLTAWGTLSAEVTVRALLAVAVGIATTRAVLTNRRRSTAPDPALVLGIAGLVFGVLGLVEMHLLRTISFTSPSTIADLAFHGAGPLLALQATAVHVSRAALRPEAVR